MKKQKERGPQIFFLSSPHAGRGNSKTIFSHHCKEKCAADDETKRKQEYEQNRAESEREHKEAEATRRENEKEERRKSDELRERLTTLGSYKDSDDLVAYLNQYEFVIQKGGIVKAEWADKLVTRLPPKLGDRARTKLDSGGTYDEIKNSLLRAVGATVAVYGHKFSALSSESIRKMDAATLMEHLHRIIHGLLQEANTVEDAEFYLTKATLQEYLPQNSQVFLETTASNNIVELREVVEAWLSTRMPSDMSRVPGGNSSNNSNGGQGNGRQQQDRSSSNGRNGNNSRYGTGRRDGDRLTRTVYGRYCHKTETCWYNKSNEATNTLNMKSSEQQMKVMCYTCKQEGHKSNECPQKNGGSGGNKQPPPKGIKKEVSGSNYRKIGVV